MAKNSYFIDSQSLMSEHAAARAAGGAAAFGLAGIGTEKGVRELPPELAAWLVGLRLLERVPFHYLVPDARMLPPESVRFFYIDRTWTDRLIDGAMSAGAVSNGELLLARDVAAAARQRLDEASGTLGGHVTGFFLRSTLVRRWPRMEIRAYRLDANTNTQDDHRPSESKRLRNLRIARLSESILLALWHGVPNHVEIEEPKHGVQFGVNPPDANSEGINVHPRSMTDGSILDESGVGILVHQRAGSAPGVLDIAAMAGEMDYGEAQVTSRHVAMAMQQMPFIQPFRTGEVDGEEYYPAVLDEEADEEFIGLLAHTVPLMAQAVNPNHPLTVAEALARAPVPPIEIAQAVEVAVQTGLDFLNPEILPGDND